MGSSEQASKTASDQALKPGRREGARASVVWDVLRGVLADRAAQTGRERLDVIDAGGGTGGFAVPLAALGHHVTVVDPSPDSLAAAQRRAAEMNVPIAAIQGEAGGLDSVAGEEAADLVICHSVLEYVDSPADALSAIARVLRPDGTVSVLAASAVAAVLHRALAGRFADAHALLDEAVHGPLPAARRGARRRRAAPVHAAGTGRADRGRGAPSRGRARGAHLRRPRAQRARGHRSGRGGRPAVPGGGGRRPPAAPRHRRPPARAGAPLRR